jgi:hypothetical protein
MVAKGARAAAVLTALRVRARDGADRPKAGKCATLPDCIRFMPRICFWHLASIANHPSRTRRWQFRWQTAPGVIGNQANSMTCGGQSYGLLDRYHA